MNVTVGDHEVVARSAVRLTSRFSRGGAREVSSNPCPSGAALRRLQASVRPPTSRDRIQCFRRDVRAIGPDNRAAVDEVTHEEIGRFERFEHRPVQPLKEVDRLFRPVVENNAQPETTLIRTPFAQTTKRAPRRALSCQVLISM